MFHMFKEVEKNTNMIKDQWNTRAKIMYCTVICRCKMCVKNCKRLGGRKLKYIKVLRKLKKLKKLKY